MPTLGEKVKEYYESQHFKALSKNTQRSYQTALESAIESFGENIPIEEAAVNVQRFINFLEKKSTAGTSIQLRLQCFKIFLNKFDIECKFSYRIPRDEIKKRKIKHAKRWFTDEEIQMCLDYQFMWKPEKALLFRIMVRLLIESGARIGELSEVRWKDVNTKTRTIFLGESKTEPRAVFISYETAGMIEMWKKSLIGVDKDDLLIGTVETIKSAIEQMLYDLGIKQEGDYRAAHTFRHYTATKLFYDGNMRKRVLDPESIYMDETSKMPRRVVKFPRR